MIFIVYFWLAGAAGIEPANADTKNRCLTTWLRPISSGAQYREIGIGAQRLCEAPLYRSALKPANLRATLLFHPYRGLKLSQSDYLIAQVNAHRDLVDTTWSAVQEPFAQLLAACAIAVRQSGKILLFGNGGSAADAQHIAAELSVRFLGDRPAIAALALTTDTSVLTATANDMGFAAVFSRQIEALGRAGDVAIGISTSGTSRNILAALSAAQNMGLTAAAFGGREGGGLSAVADPVLVVPSDSTARIQEMHILLGHMLCGALERELELGEG